MTRSRPYLAALGALGALTLALSACGSSTSSDSPSATDSATPDPEPTLAVGTADPTTIPTQVSTPAPAPAPSEEDQEVPAEAPAELEPVAMGEAVQVSDTVLSVGTPHVSQLTPAPGERGGEGVLVPVTVANTSSTDVSLEGLVVSVTWGPDLTPAPEVTGSSDEVPSSVAPGAAVVIEFAFMVPAEGRSDLRVAVDLGASSAAAVFTGSL